MTTSASSPLFKLAMLAFATCSILPVDGLVIPPIHNSAGMAGSHHKDDFGSLRPYSGFFRRSPHPADSTPSSANASDFLPSLLIPEYDGRLFRVFGQAEFDPHIDSIIKRQAQGAVQTAAGVPGTLTIMDPSRNVTFGSLVLASATNTTSFENSTASSFVLNAANATGTELLLVPVLAGNASANATTMLVTMQISILDAATASLEAYCATMNDDPGVPTQATMEPCMAFNSSNASTTGPFVVHKVQTFMYDFVTGVVTPQFQTTTTTASSSTSKRELVVRQNPSSVAATSTPVSVASSATSAAPTSTLPVSAASSAKSSVASTVTGTVAPSAASATATVTSAASSGTAKAASATDSAPAPAPTLNAVLVFVPSVAGEVAPHDEAVVMPDHAYLQDTSASTKNTGGTPSSTDSSATSTISAITSMTTGSSSSSAPSDSSVASSTSASTTSSSVSSSSGSTTSTASSSSTAAPTPPEAPAVSMILNLIQMTEPASAASATSTEVADGAMTTVTVTDYEQASTTESSTAMPAATDE